MKRIYINIKVRNFDKKNSKNTIKKTVKKNKENSKKIV